MSDNAWTFRILCFFYVCLFSTIVSLQLWLFYSMAWKCRLKCQVMSVNLYISSQVALIIWTGPTLPQTDSGTSCNFSMTLNYSRLIQKELVTPLFKALFSHVEVCWTPSLNWKWGGTTASFSMLVNSVARTTLTCLRNHLNNRLILRIHKWWAFSVLFWCHIHIL